MPTFAQVYKAFVNLAFADNLPIGGLPYGTPGYEGTISNMDKKMIDQAISQVNGYPFVSSYTLTSNVVNKAGIGLSDLRFVMFYFNSGNYTWEANGNSVPNGTRPFITY